MNTNKYILCIWVCLASSFLSGQNLPDTKTFRPVLLKAEVSSDLIQPDDTLLVTCWFQNQGSKPSSTPLQCFAELSFGHQRILEYTPKFHRFYWDPYPATNFWEAGEIRKTTFKCKMRPEGGGNTWGGTYTIHIGLCDNDHLPVKIVGENGKSCLQAEIGKIDLAWDWGIPEMDRLRKSFEKTFNETGKRKNTPANTSGQLSIGSETKVILEKSYPAIIQISGTETNPATRNLGQQVSVREYETDRVFYSGDGEMTVTYRSSLLNKNAATYKCTVERKNEILAEYNLNFVIAGSELQISMDAVKEKDGYELLEINMPSLLGLGGNDVEMVTFAGGGRLVRLDNAITEGFTFNYDTRNAAALLNAAGKFVVESACIDDKMSLLVMDDGKTKTANIGMVLVNKVRGHEKVRSIPVEHPHTITVNLLDTKWGNDGWQAVARFLRKDLKGVNRDLYRRALFQKKLATSGPQPPEKYLTKDAPYPIKRLAEVLTFKEINDFMIKQYHILDGMPQILYIGGFQKYGFDVYPYVYDTDKRAGTIEELRGYIAGAGKYNTIMTMHDNYDSDVLNSADYDPRIACMDAYSNPWMGWFWAGGIDHIVAPYKYAKLGIMQERVKKTVEIYGIKNSYHLDVLTSEPLRFDFDPQYQASAEKSQLGKFAIIDEFNKYGIDITSETLVHPYVGRIGYALHARTNLDATFFHTERFIPLIDMVYHGIIPYGSGRGDDEALLMALFKGSNCFIGEEALASDEDIRWIYLQQMPVGLLYDKKIDRIIEDGDQSTVIYDSETYVKVNFSEKTYEVKVDGRIVAKNWTTFVPGFKPDTYLAYSSKSETLIYKAPDGWNEKTKIRAVTLTFDGEGVHVPCKIEKDHIMIDIPEATPVKIVREN